MKLFFAKLYSPLWAILGLHFALFLGWGCHPMLYPTRVQNNFYTLDSTATIDPTITAIVAPYKQRIDAEMSQPLAVLAQDMNKAQPESLLTNCIADGILAEVRRQNTDLIIDFSTFNLGGIRLPSVSQGTITVGTVFELLPFDNMLTIVELDSVVLYKLLSHIASTGGWPISSEAKLILTPEEQLQSAAINNQPIQQNKTYRVLMPDYVANGGDKCDFLKKQPRTNLPLLNRDAFMQYLKRQGNTPISSSLDGRISYAK